MDPDKFLIKPITENGNMQVFKKTTPNHIDKEKTEHCVLCHKPLDILQSTPIDRREYFIRGCGQLCADCYKEIAQDPRTEDLTSAEIEQIATLFGEQ